MNELPLFDEPTPRDGGTDNIFVGFLLPKDIALQASERSLKVREEHSVWGKQRPIKNLHVTLFHVGNFAGVPRDMVDLARRACAAAAALSQDFLLEMDQAACFKAGRNNVPLVLKCRERNPHLDLLQQRLVIQFARLGIRSKKKSKFEPHVTSAYIEGSFPTEEIEPVAWMAESIVLIHSLMGQSTYIELGRWKLGS